MPRKRKPPRLYTRKDDGAVIILDGRRQIRTGFTEDSYEQAQEALLAYTRSMRSGVRSVAASKLTIAEALLHYVEAKAPEVKSPERLAYAVDRLNDAIGNCKVEVINGSFCRSYQAGRKKASSSTVRRELGVLQAALNHCHKEGILTSQIKVTLPPSSPPRERFLTRNDVARLLRVSPRHLRRFILISVYTGRRMRAVLGLRWDKSGDSGWVDLERGIIHFLGDEEKETSKRKGAVRCPVRLLAHLRRWRREGGSHVVMWRGSTVNDIGTAFDAACVRAKIKDAVPHTLKHTAITLALQGGMTIEAATEYFATTADTLMRVYRQHSLENQRHAAEQMNRIGRADVA